MSLLLKADMEAIELSTKMIGIASNEDGSGNTGELLNAAALLMRFSVETAFPKDMWVGVMALVCTDLMSIIKERVEENPEGPLN
jgi:hypothetical protein